MHQVWHGRGSAVALVAAFVLVLQSFLAASAGTAVQAPAMLDAYGNPLCITGVDHGRGDPAGDHAQLPDCCALGCNHVSLLPAASQGDATGLLRPLTSTAVSFRLPDAIHAPSPGHDPGSPRAPPPTA